MRATESARQDAATGNFRASSPRLPWCGPGLTRRAWRAVAPACGQSCGNQPAAEAQRLAKGNASLAHGGKGTGWNSRVAFGGFIIE